MGLISLLAELIGIPSVSGSEQALAVFCENYLTQAGWQVVQQPVIDGRYNLLARKGVGPFPWLLISHLDTVPPQGIWSVDPYELHIHGDHLMGLGASDMKAGLAILLGLAAEAPVNPCFQLALTVDEEVWSQGASRLAEHPWLLDTDAILVPELGIDSPHEHLTVGRRGHFCFDVVLQNPVGHGAVMVAQDNPIYQAAHLITAFQARWQQHYPTETLLFREIEGHQDTLSTPTACQLRLSVLSQPQRSLGQVWQELETIAQQIGVPAQIEEGARPTRHPMGYRLESDNPHLQAFHQVAEQRLKQSVALVEGVSVADENVLYHALKIPVLSFAPVGGHSHQPGDWVSAASLTRVMEVYRTFFQPAGEP